jgi:hypothetical protein
VVISFKNIQHATTPHKGKNIQQYTRVESMNLHVIHATSYIEQTRHSLKQRYQDHIKYIKHNELLSAYALHILNNKHEYGPINDMMSLLKYIDKTTLLLPFEQLYIQSYHHHKQMIPERHITVHFGPCEEDGSSVWEWEFFSGRHPMSKRTWDTGVMKVIKRERNQAIELALGGKCQKDRSGRFTRGCPLKTAGCASTVH